MLVCSTIEEFCEAASAGGENPRPSVTVLGSIAKPKVSMLL